MRGHTVIATSRQKMRLEQGLVKELLAWPNFDIRFRVPLASEDAEGIDALVNLASPASLSEHHANPIGTIQANLQITETLLSLAEATGKPLIQISSGEIYGEPEGEPIREDFFGKVRHLGTRAAYVESKRMTETLVDAYGSQRGVDGRIVRLFSTFGPGIPIGNGRVVSNFVRQALSNKPLQIFGRGNSTRTYCFVSDAVEAISKVIERESWEVGPINIGSDEAVTLEALATTVIEETGSSSTITHTSEDASNDSFLVPDIGLAKRELHWSPVVNLQTGIALTAQFMARELRQN